MKFDITATTYPSFKNFWKDNLPDSCSSKEEFYLGVRNKNHAFITIARGCREGCISNMYELYLRSNLERQNPFQIQAKNPISATPLDIRISARVSKSNEYLPIEFSENFVKNLSILIGKSSFKGKSEETFFVDSKGITFSNALPSSAILSLVLFLIKDGSNYLEFDSQGIYKKILQRVEKRILEFNSFLSIANEVNMAYFLWLLRNKPALARTQKYYRLSEYQEKRISGVSSLITLTNLIYLPQFKEFVKEHEELLVPKAHYFSNDLQKRIEEIVK